jgi:iron(III) transport system substrate-binding protein
MGGILRSLTFVVAGALLAAACGGGGPAATSAPTATAAATTAATAAPGFDEAGEAKKLYDAAVAAKESEVNLYSSINEQEAGPLLEIWAKQYPTIKANYIRASESALISRILTEAQANKNNFDVVATTSSHQLGPAGLALKYFPPNVVAKVPESVRDKDGLWFSIYTNWNVVQFNTNKVKKGDITRYEDFLKPQFKGQIVIDDSDVEWYQGLVASMGQQQADDLIKNIVKTNGVTVIDGHGTVSDKVVAGEFAVALNNYVNQPERAKRQGAPTEWVAIEPVTIITAGKVAVAAKAPHPNAAKLMANFLASTEGQKYLATRGRQITRSDVPQDPPDLLKGISKTYTAPVLPTAEQAELTKKFKSLFK